MIARSSLTLTAIYWLGFVSIAIPQEPSPSTAESENKSLERFEAVLLRSPKKGIALDKVYEAHIQRGDLDEYLQQLESKAVANSTIAANHYAVIGLLESQRSRDLPAIAWLKKAEELAPNEPMLSFYVAQSEVFAGRTSDAIESFQRAIGKNPTKLDRLPIEESLARLYLRTQQRDKAETVWKRLEASFPNDLLVQERIAQLNQSEGNLLAAMNRYEALANATKDSARKSEFACNVAALLAQSGKTNEAITRYEEVVAQLKPDSWRYKEIRRRIESMFLSTNDYEGWIRYLQTWLEKHPDDTDSEIRLAQAFFFVRKAELAEKRLKAAILRSPSNQNLLLALIQVHQSQKEWLKAAETWAQLVDRDPNRIDHRIQWGNAVYQSSSENRDKAITIWSSIPKEREKDVPSLLQVSDALSRIQAWEPAIAFLQKGITQSRSDAKTLADPQFLDLTEELGELYWKAGQKDKAIATWKELALPPNDSLQQRRRLVAILRTNGLYPEAISVMKTVLDEVGRNQETASATYINDFMTASELLIKAKESKAAVEAVREALKRVDSESGEAYFSSLSRILKLEEDHKPWMEFASQARADSKSSIEQLTAATIFFELGKQDAGIALIEQVVGDARDDSPLVRLELSRSLDMFRVALRLNRAIEICHRLMARSRQNRSLWEKQLARLHLKNGEPDKAVAVAKALLEQSNASNADLHDCAMVCVDANNLETGIELWSVAVRKDPSYRLGHQQIAEYTAKLGRTDESIAAHWKVFDLSQDLTDQNAVIQKLAPIYLQRRRMSELIEKLEDIGKEKQSERLSALWRSTAYQSVRSYLQARTVLEPLVQSDSFDPTLVEMIASLAEVDRDFPGMITWQERLVQMDPSDRNRLALGKLYNSVGDRDRACEIYLNLVRSSKTINVRNTAMEYLYLGKHTPEAIAFCNDIAKSGHASWEIQGIAMYILLQQKQSDAALAIAKNILAISEPASANFSSMIPNTIQQGTYVSYQTALKSSAIEQQLDAASGMAYRLEPTNRQDSSVSSNWGPVRSFFGLVGAARGVVYHSLTSEARADRRAKYQSLLRSESITDQQLLEAMILELTTPGAKPSGNETFGKTLKSPEFRVFAKELWKRGYREGVDLYLTSNLADLNQKTVPEEDLNLAVEVLRKGVPDDAHQYFMPVRLVLFELTKKGRMPEAEELVSIIFRTRNGSVRNSVINFCKEKNSGKLILTIGKQLTELQPTSQLYTTAYSLPEFVQHCLSKKLDEPETVLELLHFYLDRQSAIVSKMPRSNRSHFVSLIDVPYSIQLPKRDYGIFDLTYYLPIELQGFLVAIQQSNADPQRYEKWFDELRRVADLPMQPETRERHAVYLAATAYVEHLRGNVDARTKYLKLWREAIDSPEIVDLLAAGIQYRDNQFRECLASCDRIAPSNFATSSGLTRLRLQASLKTGDVELSRRIATSLAITGLSITDQVNLAKTLSDLELPERGRELLDSIRFRVPFSNLREVMNTYDALGAKDSAIEIAKEIVRKTVYEASWDSPSNTFALNNQPNARQEALKYLASAGALAALRDEIRKQYEAAPGFERTAIQLVNICAEMGDIAMETELRKKFNRPSPSKTQNALNNPFGQRTKVLTIPEIEAMLKADPTSWVTLDSFAIVRLSESGQAIQLVKIVTPYIEKTGWGPAYNILISHLEGRNDVVVNELMDKLVRAYGYEVFSKGGSNLHFRFLTELSTAESRKRISDTLIEQILGAANQEYIAFPKLQLTKPTFLTSTLLDVLEKEPLNYDAVKNSTQKAYKSKAGSPLVVDFLVHFAIRDKQWDLARQIASTFDPGDLSYHVVSLAESIHQYPEMQSVAMQLLDSKSNVLPMTNTSFVQLYAKVASANNEIAKRDAFLQRYYEFLLRPTTNGAFVDRSYAIETGMSVFLENGHLGEAMKLLNSLKETPAPSGAAKVNVPNRFAASIEAKINAALNETTGLDCLVQLTRAGDMPRARLESLLERQSEIAELGSTYQCPLERILENLVKPSSIPRTLGSVDATQRVALLRATLSDQLSSANKGAIKETVYSCLAKLRIAAHLKRSDLVKTWTTRLLEMDVASVPGDMVWYVASELLKNESMRAEGELLRQRLCPSPDQVQTALQYRVALDLGLEMSDSHAIDATNPWLKKVLEGFTTGAIGADQRIEVALRMADRGSIRASIDLFNMPLPDASGLPSKDSTKASSASIDTRKISGLAIEAPSQVTGMAISSEQGATAYYQPFSSESNQAKTLDRLITAWEKGGIAPTELNQIIDGLVLRPDSVWLGWLATDNRMFQGSAFNTTLVQNKALDALVLKAIALRKRTQTEPERLGFREKILQRYATASTLADRLSLGLLEHSIANSDEERREFRERAVKPLSEVQPASVSNEIALLAWYLAIQTAREWPEGPLPSPLVQVLGRTTDRLIGLGFMELLQLEAIGHLVQHSDTASLHVAGNLLDSFQQNRRDPFAIAANAAIKASKIDIALDYIQRGLTTEERYGLFFLLVRDSIPDLLEAADKLPVEKRFELLLPRLLTVNKITNEGTSVFTEVTSLFQCSRPTDLASTWAKLGAGNLPSLRSSQHLVGLLDYLVQDAKQLGRLGEVEKKIQQLETSSVAVATGLRAWFETVSQGKTSDSLFAEVLVALEKLNKLETYGDYTLSTQWFYLSLYEQLLLTNQMELAQKMFAPLKLFVDRSWDRALSAQLSQLRDLHANASKPVSNINSGKFIEDNSLQHWLAASYDIASGTRFGSANRSRWTVHRKVAENSEAIEVKNQYGPLRETLVLKYPLAGDIRIQLETSATSKQELGSPSLGGLLGSMSTSDTGFGYLGYRTRFFQMSANSATSKDKNRWELKHEQGKLQVSINGTSNAEVHLEEFAAFPFFALQSKLSNSKSFTNIRLESLKANEPIRIANTVSMLQPRMLGWSSDYSQSPLPKLPSDPKLRIGSLSEPGWQYEPRIRIETDPWSFHDGEVQFQLPDSRGNLEWDWFHYERPLDRDEVWSYSFWYEKGDAMATPVIGRTAIHLDQGCLQREWLVTKEDAKRLRVEEGKRFEIERSDKFELRDKAWNDVEIRRIGDSVSVRVNGVVVGQFAIEIGQQIYPGIYVGPGIKRCKIRNMELKGNWPVSLPTDLWE